MKNTMAFVLVEVLDYLGINYKEFPCGNGAFFYCVNPSGGYDEVLYAPLGKVFIMQSGTKPVHVLRYDTLNSKEYMEYLQANKLKRQMFRSR